MRLIYPLRYPPRVNQYFGENPQDYSKYKIDGVPLKGHEGIDLDCESGTEVVACEDGFAQEVVDQGKIGYGRYVKLIHSWGETVYAHFKSFNIKQGEQVKRGQTIGFGDSTGNSTGNHLHLGVRVNPYNRKDGWGGYSDPAPLLFSGESEISLPKWLTDFLAEKQIPLGKEEPTIRQWSEDSRILKTKDTEIQSYKDFLADLGAIAGVAGSNFADFLQKVTELRDFYNKNKDLPEDYNNFVIKVATAVSSNNTIPGKVLNDLNKFVSLSAPSNLTASELIRLGIQKLIEQIRR